MAGRVHRRGAFSPIVILMIVAVIILIALAAAFLPFRIASLSETRDVPALAGIGKAEINITSDVGNINVAFPTGGYLEGKPVEVQISATAGVGLFSTQDISSLLNVTFYYTIVGNTLYVTGDIRTTQGLGGSGVQDLSVILLIDPSLEASIYANTIVGDIRMVSASGLKIDSLSLGTTTGQIEANISRNTLLYGNMDLHTTTGGVKMVCDDISARGNITINMETTTGDIGVDLTQPSVLHGNITTVASSTTGNINLNVGLAGNVGANIESHVAAGGIKISRQAGFTGASDSLLSTNYPAANNFNFTLGTTLGDIDINATYHP